MLLWRSRKGQAVIIALTLAVIDVMLHLILGTVSIVLDFKGICLDTSLLPLKPSWEGITMYVSAVFAVFAVGNGIEHASTAYQNRPVPPTETEYQSPKP